MTPTRLKVNDLLTVMDGAVLTKYAALTNCMIEDVNGNPQILKRSGYVLNTQSGVFGSGTDCRVGAGMIVITNPNTGIQSIFQVTVPCNSTNVGTFTSTITSGTTTITSTGTRVFGTGTIFSGPSGPGDIPSYGPPGAPQTPIATVGTGTGNVTVLFGLGPNGGKPFTGFTITSSPAGGVDPNPGTLVGVLGTPPNQGAVQRVLTGFAYYTYYTFTAVAMNMLGTGPPSPPSNSVILNYTAGKVYQSFNTDLSDFYGNSVSSSNASVSGGFMIATANGGYCTVTLSNPIPAATPFTFQITTKATSVAAGRTYHVCNIQKASNTASSCVCIMTWDGTHTTMQINMSSNGTSSNVAATIFNIAASNVISGGGLHTFKTTYDGATTRKVYWDGALVNTFTGGSTIIDSVYNSLDVTDQFFDECLLVGQVI